MQEFEFNEKIMGTTLSISIVTDDNEQATRLAHDALRRLRAYEQQFSRFLPESELSRLNRERSRVVSPLFMTLLDTAKALSMKTSGYFNPLVQIAKFGYTESFDTCSGARVHDTEPYNINMDELTLDYKTSTVTLAPHQQLDFGGFLKGYLAEDEAQRIKAAHSSIGGVIVNLGGDLSTQGHDEHGNIFIFEIENPITNEPIMVPIEDQCLVTSGTYKRLWNLNGVPMHHILGRTGGSNPDSTIISASVVHEHGATAEAYAKSLFSITPQELSALVQEPLHYTLIHRDGTIEHTL